MKYFRVSQGRVCIFPFRVLNKEGRRQRKFFENETIPIEPNGRPALISAAKAMIREGKLIEMEQKKIVVNTTETKATPGEVAEAIIKFCKGTTAKGNPCKRKAAEGLDYCKAHNTTKG